MNKITHALETQKKKHTKLALPNTYTVLQIATVVTRTDFYNP